MKTPADIDRLEAAAASWAGTPFCENSRIKGAGVSCHFLPGEILAEAGWMPRLDIPEGPRNWAHGHARSLIEEWIDARPLFGSIYRYPAPAADPLALLQPGDLIGFRVGNAVHHLALALRDGRVIHAITGHGATIAPCIPDMWIRRLRRIWRLKEAVA